MTETPMDVCAIVARRIETDVLPAILRRPVAEVGDYVDPRVCTTWVAVIEEAARIAREVGESWNR